MVGGGEPAARIQLEECMDINKADRLTLKSYFRKNLVPTESNFGDLIDGMLNQKDDGIVKLPGDPLSIAAAGDAVGPQKVINFYGNLAEANPAWMLQLNPRSDQNDPATGRPGFSISDSQGVSRLFIDRTTGNVGLGTTQPATPLHLVSKVGGDVAGYGSPMCGGQHIEFGATGMWGLSQCYGILHTWETDSLFLGLKDEGANRKDAIIAFGDDPDDNLRFLFTPSGANTPVECLRITGTRNVGIGTDNPICTLDVNVRATSFIKLGLEGNGGGQLRLCNNPNDNKVFIEAFSRDGNGHASELLLTGRFGGNVPQLSLNADSTNVNGHMRVTGNVGIGTPTPNHRFHVVADDAVGLLESTGSQAYLRLSTSEGLGNRVEITNRPGGRLSLFTAGAGDVFNILRSGNVGIGSATPDRSLTIANATGANYMNVKDGTREILMGVDGAGGIISVMSDHDLSFRTGLNNEKMRINTGGDVTLKGRLGNAGHSATPKKAGWGGGIHTWDVEAEGTIWSAHGIDTSPHDLAENYYSDQGLEPGDVVSLDGSCDGIKKSATATDRLVLGVISTQPGLLLNAEHGDDERQDGRRAYPLTLSGRAPCKVTDENGSIKPGDFLVSSSSPGRAMKASPIKIGDIEVHVPGTVIGKALEPLISGMGVIEVFVLLK